MVGLRLWSRAFGMLLPLVLKELSDGIYKLGCLSGILDSHHSRNQFTPTLEKILTLEQVPKDKTISLRTAAKEKSKDSGQGFFSYIITFALFSYIFYFRCTGQCANKRCKCFKAGLSCNSRCHNKRSCHNVDWWHFVTDIVFLIFVWSTSMT